MNAGIPYGRDMGPGLGGPMFNPKTILYSMLSKAPHFLMNSLDSIILGIMAAYVVLIIFLGGSNFFVRIFRIAFVVGIGYGLGRLLRLILFYSERIFLSSSFENVERKPGGTGNNSLLSTKTRAKDSLITNKRLEDESNQRVVEMD
ncbi:unnamed protein product [Phytomonas sp. Hart1]|nr:unnamed protein product [Phytomonas sp. Hart1]|eukprot:CCW70727.1 unnamed protein product [Phytomonas sp. isolate Hart1]